MKRVAVFAVAAGIAAATACGGDDASSPAPGADGGASSSGGSSGTTGGTSGATRPYVDFDVNHVLVTGQSNSVANGGTDPLSTTQPFANLMFDTGVMPVSDCTNDGCKVYQDPTSLVPLVEGDKFFDYPVETCASGLANQVTNLATTKHGRSGHVVLMSVNGRSGNTYQCVRKGSCDYKPNVVQAFEQGKMDVQAGMKLAAAAGKSYVVRAVVAIHGESDHYSYTSGTAEFPLDGTDGSEKTIKDYSDGLLEWQRDYETDLKALTKQTEPIPMFISQISGWNDIVESKVAAWQLDAHTRAPGKVILVGPAYHLALSQADCLHFTADGERRLGEYFAKVYAEVVLAGKTWEPVRPKNVTLSGSVITIRFFVPKGPLVFDTEKVAAAENMGFTYADDSDAPPSITKVELAGPDSVTITLSAAPTGANKRVKYAMNQEVGGCIGTPRGARGNLRDSDDTPSKNGYDLQNWAVHFNVPIP